VTDKQHKTLRWAAEPNGQVVYGADRRMQWRSPHRDSLDAAVPAGSASVAFSNGDGTWRVTHVIHAKMIFLVSVKPFRNHRVRMVLGFTKDGNRKSRPSNALAFWRWYMVFCPVGFLGASQAETRLVLLPR